MSAIKPLTLPCAQVLAVEKCLSLHFQAGEAVPRRASKKRRALNRPRDGLLTANKNNDLAHPKQTLSKI
jgi:hypothetical protein